MRVCRRMVRRRRIGRFLWGGVGNGCGGGAGRWLAVGGGGIDCWRVRR